jgi:hypothetical protein
MSSKQPPHVNGVMELTEQEQTTIREKLTAIRDNFIESDEHIVADTFYITATYNRENPDLPINGDTCQTLLSEPEEIMEEVAPMEEGE